MTPDEHRRTAEQLLERARELPLSSPARQTYLAEATVCALLALTAPAPRRRRPSSSSE